MKKLLAAMVSSLSVMPVFAEDPTCNAPKDQWMKEEAFRAKVEAEGYKIENFKVTEGQCYEIKGIDKSGKKVEVYFNPETAAIVKIEHED